jgi:hypothetical protein
VEHEISDVLGAKDQKLDAPARKLMEPAASGTQSAAASTPHAPHRSRPQTVGFS